MRGVIRTRSGYTGGEKKNPTYFSLGDHTETVEIDYDPEVIDFGELLDVFWDSHSPTGPKPPRQYMSVIFYHDPEQKALARQTLNRQQDLLGQKIYTEIEPRTRFYRAEDYHQKYYLRQHPGFLREMGEHYPDFAALVDSTAAARINGYLGGYGDAEDLARELESLGLSPQSQEKLKARVR